MKNKTDLVFLMTIIITVDFAQTKKFAPINKSMSDEELVKIAAHIVPSPQQLRWQCLELTAFFSFRYQHLYRPGMGRWKKATEGTTIGFKRLLEFPSVAASKVRLRILSARLQPTLAEIGLYFDKEAKK